MRVQKVRYPIISIMLGMFLLTGCRVSPQQSTAPTNVPVALSSLDRIALPGVPTADVHELAAGNNAFAFDLYQALCGEEGNLLFSPYSISQALAMTYAGARGQTEQQMADTLHFTLPQERLHPAFNALDLELASRSDVSSGAAPEDETEEVAFELHIANAVWGQEGYAFLPEYLDVLAQHYGAGIRLIDFAQDPTGAVDAVNGWVNQETRGRISRILVSISTGAKLVLANAVYFIAEWDLPFDEEETEEEAFYLLGGGEEEVLMMHQTESFRYTDGNGYQAIELPYLGREVAMVVLLPEAGRFHDIEDRLGGEWVEDVLGAFSRQEVILSMPKFRFETPVIPLKDTLSGMGMPNAFSDGADFSGMTGAPELKIGRVLHKAFIEVDEQRTEAAASTVIEMLEVAIAENEEPPPIVMKIDRPFIFFIRDIKTGTILFVGRVMDPGQ